MTSIATPEGLLFIPKLALAFVITFPNNAANLAFSEDVKRRGFADSDYRRALTGVTIDSQLHGLSTVLDFSPDAPDEDVCAAFKAIQPQLGGARIVFVRQ